MAERSRPAPVTTRHVRLGAVMKAQIGGGRRGVALVLVLWVFTALGVIGADFARAMREGATAAATLSEELEGYYVAVSAIHHYVFRAMKKREGFPAGEAGALDAEEVHAIFPLDGLWHGGRLWEGEYGIRLTDEGGKLPLNFVDEALLRIVLSNLDVDPDTQEVITDSILDWTDSDDLVRLHGAERDFYLGLAEPYEPKNGPFSSVAELLLINGVTSELYYGGEGRPGLRDLFSVYNAGRRVNVAAAPLEVLQVLLNLGEEDLDIVREERLLGEPSLPLAGSPVDPIVGRYVTQSADNEPGVVTFEAWGRSGPEAVPARVVATVDLEEVGGGITVLRWVDRQEGGVEGEGGVEAEEAEAPASS